MRGLFLFLCLLVACGRPVKTVELNPDADRLRGLQDELLGQLNEAATGMTAGWPSDYDCDAALWAGEARAGGANWVEDSAALQPDGRPTRLPGKDCGPPGTPGAPSGGNSEATTSTDMQLGTILGLLAAHDVDALLRLQSYTDDNNGTVGTPAEDVPLVYMKPNTRTLLARAIASLGGAGDAGWAALPIIRGPITADYQRHLQLISMILQSRLGGLSPIDVVLATNTYKGATDDALAAYVAGDIPTATRLILDANWSPPTYTRGAAVYPLVHRLFVVHLLLGAFG